MRRMRKLGAGICGFHIRKTCAKIMILSAACITGDLLFFVQEAAFFRIVKAVKNRASTMSCRSPVNRAIYNTAEVHCTTRSVVYKLPFAAFTASTSIGVTLKRSPAMP